MSAQSKIGFQEHTRGRHLVVLAQHSDQVLNAILSMADRQDRFFGGSVEDLRQKVLELAAIIGR
jgi:hypothetical protein